MFLWFLFQDKVKILHLISKSAGLVIGTCSFHNKPFINSQRPNAGDLKWLVGFVEGDGYFSVNKNGKYVKYEFGIEIHIGDIKLLYKIKDILGGFGSITTRTRPNSNSALARLKIASKDDLRRVILPIFDQYGMLTSKQNDYLYFKACLLQNITNYSDLPTYNRPNITPLNSYQDILNVYYFDEWLVGFMEAESYFFTFQATNETNKTSKFGIGQNNGMQIITAIKKRLSIISTPYERDDDKETGFCVIQTSSKRGIQNTINFLKNTPVKFKGNKRAQYLKWLHELRVNPRYCNLNIPNHY
jgi:ubiquinol-cytochrome c reductase cytochrome b subunit